MLRCDDPHQDSEMRFGDAGKRALLQRGSLTFQMHNRKWVSSIVYPLVEYFRNLFLLNQSRSCSVQPLLSLRHQEQVMGRRHYCYFVEQHHFPMDPEMRWHWHPAWEHDLNVKRSSLDNCHGSLHEQVLPYNIVTLIRSKLLEEI